MDKKLAMLVAKAAINGDTSTWAMNIEGFDWHQGVALYGIYKVFKATGEEELRRFLDDWLERHIGEAYNKRTVNSTCPLLTAACLMSEEASEKYMDVCKAVAEYMITDAPITREGALEHTVAEAVDFKEQMWADTLFMACLFLAKMGTICDRKYADFAAEQLRIHIKYLSDVKSGLYFHAWNSAQKSHMSGVHWARANAWVIYAASEMIKILKSFNGIEAVKAAAAKHIEALSRYAGTDGAFCTVLDDRTSYDEASATAGIIAGIMQAVEIGIVGKEYVPICKKGMEYIRTVISPDGNVMNVSTGTPVMKSVEEYKKIPRDRPALYGQGLVCMALCLEDTLDGVFKEGV